jgi:hypothetical protein
MHGFKRSLASKYRAGDNCEKAEKMFSGDVKVGKTFMGRDCCDFLDYEYEFRWRARSKSVLRAQNNE